MRLPCEVEPKLVVNLTKGSRTRHHRTKRRQAIGDAFDRRRHGLRRMVWRNPRVGNDRADKQRRTIVGMIRQLRETVAPLSRRVVQVEGVRRRRLTAKLAHQIALLKMMGVQANNRIPEAIQTTFLRGGQPRAAGALFVELSQNRRLEATLEQEATALLKPQDGLGVAQCRKELAFMQSKTSQNLPIVT
jgi:hypothetical protein